MAVETQLEIRKIIGEILAQGEQKSASALVRLAEQLGPMFGASPHEVAVLITSENFRHLHFLVPTGLQKIGSIPLSSTNSLAARTARERKAEIVNRFTTVPHASIFEAVPIERQQGDPIQKIMSVPVMQNGELAGVLQVSRKAKSYTGAGPDFTPKQLQELSAIGEMVAPCLSLFRKV